MLATDQPTCFPSEVLVAVSSKKDGTMLDRTLRNPHDARTLARRRVFCEINSTAYDDMVYQKIAYDSQQTYTHIVAVTSAGTTRFRQEIAADALVTGEPGVGLFLPVADCVATVLYDPIHRLLALAHIGRHSAYAELPQRLVAYMAGRGSQPQDLIAWLSPAIQKASYQLDWFDHADDPAWQGFYEPVQGGVLLDLPGYIRNQLQCSGIALQQIQVSHIDTAQGEQYFSHHHGDTDGRIAVLAMLR